MNDAVKNVTTLCGLPFTDTVDLATINPATTLGISDRLGSIRVGKNASVAVISRDSFKISLTVRDGRVIFRAPEV